VVQTSICNIQHHRDKQGKRDYYYNKAETHITKINGMGDNLDKAHIHYTKINEMGDN